MDGWLIDNGKLVHPGVIGGYGLPRTIEFVGLAAAVVNGPLVRIPGSVFRVVYTYDHSILGSFNGRAIRAHSAYLPNDVMRLGEKLLDIRGVAHDDPIPRCITFDKFIPMVFTTYKHDYYDR